MAGGSLVWTRNGLRKVDELRPEDDVMGIDFQKAEYEWKTIKSAPTKNSDGELMHVFADHNEALVPHQNMVSTVDSGRKDAGVLQNGNILELFDNTKKSLERSYSERVHVPRNRLRIAYLLGICSRRTDSSGEEFVAVNVVSSDSLPEYMAVLQDLLQEILNDSDVHEEVKIELETSQFAKLNWIIIRSKYVAELLNNRKLKYMVPLTVRNSGFEILKEYLTGIFDVNSIVSEDKTITLMTSVEQHEIRRFIWNVLVYLGVPPAKTYLSPSWGPLNISIQFVSSLESLKLRNPALQAATRVSENKPSKPLVKLISRMQGPIYTMTYPDLNWSPIADLIYVHSRMESGKGSS